MRRSRPPLLTRPLGHAQIEAGTAAVKPRDAATLIVWRSESGGVEVLMGRRSRRASFVPDFFVFPGGRLDPADHAVRPATPLDPRLARRMGVRGNAKLAEALAVAAVRETFEETGLLLAGRGDVGAVADPVWAEWKAAGVAPALCHLGYFGRAVTSTTSPIRFNARFFIARADAFQGRIGGSGELSDLAYYPARRVLHDMPIIDVTEFMLRNLIEFAAAPAEADVRAPVFAYRGTVAYVRYPSSPRRRRGQT